MLVLDRHQGRDELPERVTAFEEPDGPALVGALVVDVLADGLLESVGARSRLGRLPDETAFALDDETLPAAAGRRYNFCYTFRMKTAISIPDEVFRDVERATKRLKVSRSEFFTRAVVRMLASLRDEQITASYDVAFSDDGGSSAAATRSIARAALLATEWKDG